MAKRKHTYYLPLDEDFLQDPEVQMFIEEKGKAKVFDYLMLLIRMRDYKDFDYVIPFAYLPIIAKRELCTTPEDLRDTVDYCISIGFFKTYSDGIIDGFYSDRRQNDLRTWQVYTAKCSEAGRKGNDMRWNNRDKENTDEDNKEQNSLYV